MALAKYYEQLLRGAAIPVTASYGLTGLGLYEQVAELWIEDERLLADPDVSHTIAEVLRGQVDEAEVTLAAATAEPVQAESRVGPGWLAFWFNSSLLMTFGLPLLILVVTYLLFLLLGWLVGPFL